MSERQLDLCFGAARSGRGGARRGAGRKPLPSHLRSTPHRARPAHRAAHPVHVGTLKVPALPGIPAPQVVSLAYSPDGTTVAASIATSTMDGTVGIVLLYDVATRALAGEIPEKGLTDVLAFTPDGRTLVTGTSQDAIDLWDVARRTRTAVVQPPVANARNTDGVALSPDGRTIAFGTNPANNVYDIKLWSMESREVTATATRGAARSDGRPRRPAASTSCGRRRRSRPRVAGRATPGR